MNTKGKVVLLAVVVLIAAGVVLALQPFSTDMVGPQVPSPTPTPETVVTPVATSTPTATSTLSDLIKVTSVKANDAIQSPITITGEARGTWYFEASFPVELRDAKGKVLAQVPAQAQDEWMTTKFVPFKATLTFAKQVAGSKGTLIFRKDNPSGLPEHDASIEIPVVFK